MPNVLTKPRYEGRKVPNAGPQEKPFGVFDTFEQLFSLYEDYETISEAIKRAGEMNRTYEKTLR